MGEDEISSLKRCAIYTRKSTTHLLERETNSLETQREICAAYIKSQRYKGWTELPERYDDGGQPGSGLERPALNRLMQQIEAGEIDAVVIYKVDRLTRSLLDFVRLIEIFDRHGIALVSISQAFDTSDSMGRMILNILLTFSQFERELIAERLRDSARMRKRHGTIHGGLPPFGYVSDDGQLRIVEEEAATVRFIFTEFLRTGRYTATMTAVREAGLCSALKHTRKGKLRGGTPLSPGSVYNILRNPIYVGEIRGHAGTYPGRHQPIISRETWSAAQALSDARAKPPPHGKGTHHYLAGLLWDDLGRRMLLIVDWYRGRPSYHYASSNAAWSQAEYRRAYRTSAARLDNLIRACVADFLCDRSRLRAALKCLGIYGPDLEELAVRGKAAADLLLSMLPEALPELFAALLVGVELGRESAAITFRSVELRRFLVWDGIAAFRGRQSDWSCSDARYVLEVAVSATSSERVPVLHITARDPSKTFTPDPQILGLVQSARKALQLVEEQRDQPLTELARQMRCRPAHFSRLVRLNYLAPDIVTAILDGTQPASLTREVLFRCDLPLEWSLQRRVLGFPTQVKELPPRQLFGRGMWPERAANAPE